MRLVYVSPLKALSYDIERNLRAPLAGIGADISVGLRTGDTSQAERRAMKKTPPDILITTPESLYLMLSSGVREILATTEAVIVDEIHAVAQTKRGSHLALTLERLEHLVAEAREEGSAEQQRGGSSEPSPDPASAGGPSAHRALRDAAAARADREVPRGAEAGVRDRGRGDREGARPADRRPGRGHGRTRGAHYPQLGGVPAEGEPLAHVRSIWPAIYPKLLELVQEHNSTIIFVNARRAAERLAKRLNELANGEGEGELPATEHGGHSAEDSAERQRGPRSLAPQRAPADRPGAPSSRSPGLTTDRCRHEERLVVEEMLKSGQLPCLVATSSLELGIDMGAVDLVIQVESPKSVSRGLQRVGRAGHSLGEVSRGPHLPQVPRRPARVRGGRQADARGGDRGDGDPAEPARRARPAPGLDGGARRVAGRRGRGAGDRVGALPRALPRAARERPRHARRPLPLGPLRRAAPADRLGPR